MNIEKLREYFNNRTYPGYNNTRLHYTLNAQNTRIYFLEDLEKRFSIDLDDIITDEEKILEFFKKIGGNVRCAEVSDLNSYEISELTHALRHYYRAINNKDFPIMTAKELDS